MRLMSMMLKVVRCEILSLLRFAKTYHTEHRPCPVPISDSERITLLPQYVQDDSQAVLGSLASALSRTLMYSNFR